MGGCVPGSCCAILDSWHGNKPRVRVRAIGYFSGSYSSEHSWWTHTFKHKHTDSGKTNSDVCTGSCSATFSNALMSFYQFPCSVQDKVGLSHCASLQIKCCFLRVCFKCLSWLYYSNAFSWQLNKWISHEWDAYTDHFSQLPSTEAESTSVFHSKDKSVLHLCNRWSHGPLVRPHPRLCVEQILGCCVSRFPTRCFTTEEHFRPSLCTKPFLSGSFRPQLLLLCQQQEPSHTSSLYLLH